MDGAAINARCHAGDIVQINAHAVAIDVPAGNDASVMPGCFRRTRAFPAADFQRRAARRHDDLARLAAIGIENDVALGRRYSNPQASKKRMVTSECRTSLHGDPHYQAFLFENISGPGSSRINFARIPASEAV
jgi:hypothetical protein